MSSLIDLFSSYVPSSPSSFPDLPARLAPLVADAANDENILKQLNTSFDTLFLKSASFCSRFAAFEFLSSLLLSVDAAPPAPAAAAAFLSALDGNLYKYVCAIFPSSSAAEVLQDPSVYISAASRVSRLLSKLSGLQLFKKKHAIVNATKYVDSIKEDIRNNKRKRAEEKQEQSHTQSHAQSVVDVFNPSSHYPPALPAPAPAAVGPSSATAAEANRVIENLRSSQKRKALEGNLRPEGQSRADELLEIWRGDLATPLPADVVNNSELMWKIWRLDSERIWPAPPPMPAWINDIVEDYERK